MQIGVVRSYIETFFSFKDNKILVKLSTPVFQIIVQEKGLTCISKKIEFHLSSDLNETEALVMGKVYKFDELKREFANLKSKVWISTAVDNSDIELKLHGIEKTCDGKMLFSSYFQTLQDGFNEIQRYANQDVFSQKSIIKEYCDKNISLLNNQIRLLTADKILYQELYSSL